MIAKILNIIFDFIDLLRYGLLSDRAGLDRPLICYPKQIRWFLGKYGQKMAHFGFKSTSPKEQYQFFIDYINYLANTRGVFPVAVIRENSQMGGRATVEYENELGKTLLFFSKNGEVIFLSTKEDEVVGTGALGITFEINLK